jgi:hypothetical protein
VTGRDWDKELAKIDKQLRSLSDEELGIAQPAAAAHADTSGTPRAPVARAAAGGPSWALYGRLAISVFLGVAMLFWPYETRCGVGAFAYLAAVGAVVGSGVWSAVWSWRHRAPRVHTLSLLLVLWGLVLGAIDILPRTGYARPSSAHPAGWSCG